MAVAIAVGMIAAGITYLILPKRSAGIPDAAPLSLEQLVTQVTTDLWALDSLRDVRNEYPMFSIEELSLETSFLIKSTHTREGKLEYQLIALTDETSKESENANKVVLKLLPVKAVRTEPTAQE
jgi:hypothetical protein